MNFKKSFVYIAMFFLGFVGVTHLSHARMYYAPNVIIVQPGQPIYWGSSTFYMQPNGTVTAPYYTQQTINDLVNMTSYYNIQQVNFIPAGNPGAFPPHLFDYAYYRFSDYNIKVLNYHPQQPRYPKHAKKRNHIKVDLGDIRLKFRL